MNKFSTRIKELREEKGLSIRQLAKEIHFADSAISRWERGVQIPNIEVLIAFALYFNVTADYLLGLDN